MEAEENGSDSRRREMKRSAEEERAVRGSEASESGRDNGALIDCYVGRDSSEGTGRVLLGKVVSYDEDSKLFSIFYEDGHLEDLECSEVSKILMVDEGGSNMKLSCRKRKLDQLVTSGGSKTPNTRLRKNAPHAPYRAEASSLHQLGSDLSEDADSSSDSCDYDRALVCSSSSEAQIVPLPPSSGDISVPEESISYLFSVYSFLRSFSLQLFLSPFGLDDFVGSLNCTVQNSLLDAIHISLMRAVRRHLQMLSSDGSELASKCLRHHDWNLLDALTWPAILVEYLYIMGYMKGLDEKGFCLGEYYGLPVATKLKVLQILCDDVVDSAELRTELEMRENMEEENEYNLSASVPLESGPRRVHPRYSKTSACKNLEALENSVEPKMPNPNSKVSEADMDVSDAAQDGNSDECRLCGMDGTLICCDGCPSAYHSRCIGLNKAFLPNGLWFCPECTANKPGMTSSRIGRGTSGAVIFGTDANGRVFLGTCNYLLVVGTSLNSESLARYYNQDDVIKVLSAIGSTAEEALAYADIRRGMSEYWEVPLVIMQSGKPEPIRDPLVDKEPAICYIPLSIILPKRGTNVLKNADGENYMTTLAEGSPDNRAVIFQKDGCDETKVNGSTLDSMHKADFPDSQKYVMASHDDMCINEAPEAADKTFFPVKDEQFGSENATLTVQTMSTEISKHLGNGSVVTDMSYSNQPISAERLIVLDTATCGSENENGICREDAGSSNFSTKHESVSISHDGRLECHINDEKYRIKSQRGSNKPAFFKPQAYINQYIQGDVAASAAANLAVLASEESKVSEAHVSSNPKKTVAANIALQMKAFSGAAINFLWPSFEKKLMEVPRERCGWCIACKGPSSYKKGCLLNLAATNAIKRSARNFSGFRPIKHVESHLPIIAAQIAHMEESLRGLIVGPLSDVEYNKQWCKLVREASSCRVLKFLLLELEKNIHGIAFAGGWMKLVDDWLVEFSCAMSGMCRTGPSKKRGPGGRRNRKQSVDSEFEHYSSRDSWKNVQWWRGGKLSKVVFQSGALPSSMVKKAGRQGGIRRISGIHYPEGSELPRRSRQFAWRAAVEMSKNASQLALQVRYLDAHVRWRDLVRPEQSPLDGKGSDVDATAFRNAVICDKKIAENKIKYALTFSIQKHLPLRVTKNILESEKTQDENEKLWFSENHVPLYLIKEYEEKVGVKPMPCSMMLRSHCLPRFWRRQRKDRGDIFSYLIHKGEKPSKCSCASCQQDVSLRDAVRCSTCQGYYHKDCTIPSTVVKEDHLEFSFTCNLCYRSKSAALIASSKDTLKTQLSFHGQNQLLTGAKCILQIGHHNNAQPVGKVEVQSEMRSSASGPNSERKARRGGQSVVFGLIWKRKKGDDSGKDFRIENIILKGKEGFDPSRKPTCCLCGQPYRSDLMYVRCEKCLKWYHADALELEEAQIFDLVGFKCCKCRRKSQPKCPYLNRDYKKPDAEPLTPVNVERNKGALSEVSKLGHSSTLVSNSKLEDFVIVDDDPLLYSVGRVELFGEQTVDPEVQLDGPGLMSKSQQKLSVRRPQVKHEKDASVLFATQNAIPKCTEFSESLQNFRNPECGIDAKKALATEEANLMSASEKLSSTQVEWDSSIACGYSDGVLDNMDLIDQLHDPEFGINEDMEYEPQTYFSFTELLASEDGEMDNQCDMPIGVSENWSLDDFGTIYQDVPPYDSCGAYETGLENQFAVGNNPAFDGVTCNKCKLSQPSPDLQCEICAMSIHSHCSPWVESEEEPSCGDTKWRCGRCRDWR